MSSSSSSKRKRVLVWSLGTGVALMAAAGIGYLGVLRWREADAADARMRGFALFEAGKFSEALPLLSKAVARDRSKTDAEAIRRLARARLMVPEPNNAHLAAAVRFYSAAVAADPADLESRKTILEILARAGRLVEAESVAKEIIALDPEVPLAREALLQIALQRGDAAGAIAMLEERIRARPEDFESKLRLVEISLASGRDPSTVRVLVEGWLADPQADPTLRVGRVAIMQRTGDRAGMAGELEALESVQPRSASGCLVLASIFRGAGRPSVAKRILLDGAARIDGASERLASEAARASILDDDLETADRAISLAEGEEGAGWTTRARLRVASLREDLAEVDRIVALEGTSAEDRTYGAAIRSSLAQRPGADDAAAVAEAVRVDPGDFVLLGAQARLRAAMGDLAGAINALEMGFKASGGAWVRGAARLAPALESSGDRARAAAVVRELVQRQPGNPVAQSMILSVAAEAAMRGEEPPIPGLDVSSAATQLAESVRANPEALPLAVVALVGAGRAAEAAALVGIAVEDERVTGANLLAVARASMGIGAGSTELRALLPRLLETALARGADARQVESFRAAGGSEQSLDALVAMAEGGDVVALRNAAQLADSRLLPRARPLLERLLGADPTIEGKLLVLGSETAARDRELLEMAIAAIDGTGGASDATLAARARLLLMKGGATRAEIDESLESLDDLRRRRGDSADTLATMARLMLAADASDARPALRLAAQAADLAPDRVPVQFLAATIAREAGDAVRAREHLGRIVRLVDQGSAGAELCLLVAAQRAELGDLADAARLASRGAEAARRADAWLEAALRAAAAGDDVLRERALRAAVASSDAQPVASARLALFLGSKGRIDEARSVVDALAATMPATAMLPIRVEFDLSYGDRSAGLAALDAGLAATPDDPALLALKAAERRSAGDLPAALEIARRLIERDRTNAFALDVALQASALAGATGDAGLELLSEAGVAVAEPLRELRAMRDGKAPASLARARELALQAPRLWLAWAMALDVAQRLGDAKGRADLAAVAARQLPNDPTALLALAALQLEAGEGDAAVAAVDQLRAIPGTDRSQVERLAVLAALATKDPDAARRIAVRFHAETGDLDAALLASAIDAQRGDVAAGYARIRTELPKSPAALQVWLARSMTLAPKDARQLLELASEHEALAPEAFVSMWSALAIRGGLNAADRAKAIAQRMPENPERKLLQAAVKAEVELARADAGALAEARSALAALVPESFRGVLEGRSAPAPDGSEAARYVAEIAASEALLLVERRRDVDRALSLVDAALSLVDAPGYRVTRGRAMLLRGDVSGARELAESLTTRDPMNVDAWVLLANAALRSGDQIVARRAVERARDAAARTFFVAPSVLAEVDLLERSARETLEPLG